MGRRVVKRAYAITGVIFLEAYAVVFLELVEALYTLKKQSYNNYYNHTHKENETGKQQTVAMYTYNCTNIR